MPECVIYMDILQYKIQASLVCHKRSYVFIYIWPLVKVKCRGLGCPVKCVDLIIKQLNFSQLSFVATVCSTLFEVKISNIIQNMSTLIRYNRRKKSKVNINSPDFYLCGLYYCIGAVNQSWFIFKNMKKCDTLLVLWKTVLKKNYNNSNDNKEW